MNKKIQEFMNYVRRKGANLLEIILQNYNLIFYSCLYFNLIIICIILVKEIYLVSFIFSLSMLIVLILNKLISVGEIKRYGDVHKKILFMNIILLILNIINISLMYSDIYVTTLLKLYEGLPEFYYWIISKLKLLLKWIFT